jgi:hypothetical protein
LGSGDLKRLNLLINQIRDQVTYQPSSLSQPTHQAISYQSHINFISMSFSEVYGDILLPFVENYKEAKNEKNRAQVVKNAADAVSSSSQLLEDQGVNLPKDLKSVRICPFSILLHCY